MLEVWDVRCGCGLWDAGGGVQGLRANVSGSLLLIMCPAGSRNESGNSNSHGARPVHSTISMIKWIRTIRSSIKNSLAHQNDQSLVPRGWRSVQHA